MINLQNGEMVLFIKQFGEVYAVGKNFDVSSPKSCMRSMEDVAERGMNHLIELNEKYHQDR